MTKAVRFLREKKIPFEPHFYAYEEHGGTRVASESLGVSEHATIKTIVMITDEQKPLVVLMHGDQEVSAKNLARTIGVKNVQQCDDRTAGRVTGYVFGGMSPFGTKSQMPVYVESSIFLLEKIYINGGKRGFLVQLKSSDLEVLKPIRVEVGVSKL